MPYFSWSGVDIVGKTYTGKMFAISEQALDHVLFKRGIATLRSKPIRLWHWRSLSLESKISFLQQLSILLHAGVLLPQALQIIQEQHQDMRMQEMVQQLMSAIESGISIEQACTDHPHFFSTSMIAMIAVGNHAGRLPTALDLLTNHLNTVQMCRKKIRTASIMPALTFVIFLCMALILLLVIIPMITSIIESSGNQIPTLTQALMSVSTWLHSRSSLIFLSIIVCLCAVALRYSRTTQGKKMRDMLFMHCPGTRSVVRSLSLLSFFQSLSMLLESGMLILPALSIAEQSIDSNMLQAYAHNLKEDIGAGSSLSQALMSHQDRIFAVLPDTIAMIRVGEESGTLPTMLKHVVRVYDNQLQGQITFYTTLLQPSLIVAMGICIGILVAGLYVPILTMAHIL